MYQWDLQNGLNVFHNAHCFVLVCFSTLPKTEEKTDYVIPLIKKNNWRLPVQKPDGSARSDGQDDELRQQAADAILKGMMLS